MEDYKIVEKAKPTAEIKERALEIKRMAMASALSKRKDIECWNMYNEIYNERDFDYLRKVGQYEYPAKIRWIGIQRKAINYLSSHQAERAFVFSVASVDRESQSRKYNTMYSSYINTLYMRLKEVNKQYTQGLLALEQKRSQLQQIMQQEITTPEQQQQVQALQQQLPMIEMQLNEAKDIMENNKYMDDKDIEKIKMFYRYTFKEIEEQKAQAGLQKIRLKLDIKQKSTKNFTAKMVTGKEYWFVDYKEGNRLPTVNPLDAIKVYYPINDEVFWVEEGDWVVVEQLLSYEQVKKEFGKYLSYQDMEHLKRWKGSVTPSGFVSTPGSGAYLHDNIYAGTMNTSQNLRVWRVYYREERKILARQMPNPYKEGAYFTHFIDQDDLIKNPIREKKGEKLVERYVDDIYEGVVIVDDIVPYCRKKPFIWRSVDDYSFAPLPVIGKTHNNITDRPYSLIWATKDIQILYNIIHYHRELMLAVSGVKGTIMDISQKPEGMSMEEWTYQKKLGTGWIETYKKGRSQQPNYNQFKGYDDTVSPAIDYLERMLQSLDMNLMQMLGINYQALGQTTSTDQVGTNRMAIDQSSVVTRILFTEHDECERRVLRTAVNLATRYCWNDGELLNLMDSKNGNEYVNILPGELGDKDWDVYLENNRKEEQNMDNLKQLSMELAAKGVIPFTNVVSMYNVETLKELEKKLEYYTEQAQELAQQNAGASEEAEAQRQERLAKLNGEIQAQLQQNTLEIDKTRLQLEQANAQFNQQLESAKLSLEQKKLENENNIKMADVASEREIEGAYLKESNRSNTVSERLAAMELQLNAHNSGMEIQMAKEQSAKDHHINLKKVEVDKAKALNKGKEKII